MIEKRNETEIQGTIEDVWEALTDLAQYSEWNPTIYRAVGTIEVGEKVNIWAGGRQFTCEVARLDPQREFSWKFHGPVSFLYRGEHIFRLEPVDDQKVRLVDREIFEGLLVAFRRSETNVTGGMIAMGKALKARVENRTL